MPRLEVARDLPCAASVLRPTAIAILLAVVAVWFVAPPVGLTVEAWRLFAIFAGAIVCVVINAAPILTASVFAVAASVLTGLLSPEKAYAGFANGTILLIVLAFLVARSVVKCGLGARHRRDGGNRRSALRTASSWSMR